MLSLKYHGLRPEGGRYSTATQISNRGWTADWHTVGVDWRPGKLAWYVDGVMRKVVEDEPRLSMYLIANLAICSGAHCPAPKLSTPFPSDHRIDWIRAWRR
jgi:beta-glucanase (GH16 family)